MPNKKSYYQYNAFSGEAITPRPKHYQAPQTEQKRWVDREYVTTGYRVGIAPRRITSTTIVECFPPKEKIKNQKSLDNLKKNMHGGKLSNKALSKMANAIDWLLASATTKEVFQKSTGKTFQFKINFITLTLPDTCREVTDDEFKNKLCKLFFNDLRKYYELNNYIWKIEFQKNGKLHLHFTSDTFIHHATLRRVWNKHLKNAGLMDDFKKKFGHDNPNSTDVHSVYAIDNLAAYLMKYISKQDEQLSKIKGRIWGCSQKLSKALKTRVVVEPNVAAEYYESLNHEEVEAYDIEASNASNGKVFVVARIFKISYEWLRTRAHAQIRALAHDVLLMLRGALQFQPPKLYYV